MKKKLFITCAITGSQTNKALSPYHPTTIEEIAQDTVNVAKAGAAIVHFHLRDKDGLPCMDTGRWVEQMTAVREALAKEKLDLVLNVTASGSKFPEELRLNHLKAVKPEICSFDAGSMNWGDDYVFLNRPQFLEALGELCIEEKIKPELEVFDAGMLGNCERFLKRGFLQTPLHYQLMMGVKGGMDATIENVTYLVNHLNPGSTWAIAGIGKAHMPMLLAGLAAGCDGLRVGLEDNVMLEKGVYATNTQLVERAIKISELAGREIATPAEAREILGLTQHINHLK